MTATGSGRIRGILREPALHFLLLGALAFVAWPEARPEIVVSAAEIEALEGEFTAEAGRPPSPAERAALREAAVEERILLAEAFRLGLDRHDSAVATRLARVGAFVTDEPTRTARDASTRARELGLERSDPVIRRYLVERMRQILARGAGRAKPTDAELEAHLRANAARFSVPERIRFRHVFLSRHARAAPGAARESDARTLALGARLADLPLAEASALGDPFPRGRRMDASPDAIARSLGPDFLAGLDLDHTGAWQGPVASTYGRHFVFVESVVAAETPALVRIRSRVERDLVGRRREERLARRLGELRRGYEIRLP